MLQHHPRSGNLVFCFLVLGALLGGKLAFEIVTRFGDAVEAQHGAGIRAGFGVAVFLSGVGLGAWLSTVVLTRIWNALPGRKIELRLAFADLWQRIRRAWNESSLFPPHASTRHNSGSTPLPTPVALSNVPPLPSLEDTAANAAAQLGVDDEKLAVILDEIVEWAPGSRITTARDVPDWLSNLLAHVAPACFPAGIAAILLKDLAAQIWVGTSAGVWLAIGIALLALGVTGVLLCLRRKPVRRTVDLNWSCKEVSVQVGQTANVVSFADIVAVEVYYDSPEKDRKTSYGHYGMVERNYCYSFKARLRLRDGHVAVFETKKKANRPGWGPEPSPPVFGRMVDALAEALRVPVIAPELTEMGYRDI